MDWSSIMLKTNHFNDRSALVRGVLLSDPPE